MIGGADYQKHILILTLTNILSWSIITILLLKKLITKIKALFKIKVLNEDIL